MASTARMRITTPEEFDEQIEISTFFFFLLDGISRRKHHHRSFVVSLNSGNISQVAFPDGLGMENIFSKTDINIYLRNFIWRYFSDIS